MIQKFALIAYDVDPWTHQAQELSEDSSPIEAGSDNSREDRATSRPPSDDGSISGHLAKLTLDTATDFAIICEGQRFMAHKSVLEKASPYFERMFRFHGQETTQKEVELHDIDKSSMRHILEFMYTGHYNLPGGKTVPSNIYCNHESAALKFGPLNGARIFKRICPCSGMSLSPKHLLQHIRIYAIADYFGMFELKKYARAGAGYVLHTHWDEEDLDLADALEEGFYNTPEEDRGIRQMLVAILRLHPSLWVDEGDAATWLHENPEVLEKVEYD